MSKIAGFAIFAAGAVTGSLATWQILKKKYERIVQEEIQSVKEAFGKKYKQERKPEIEQAYKDGIEAVQKYNNIIQKEGYISEEQDDSDDKVVVEEFTYGKPFVISPDEFDENDDYKVVGLSYFADKKLADVHGNLVNMDDIGEENLKYIGEFEDDCVHIRNVQLKTDYEIILDPRRYSEVYKGQ